MSSEAIKTLPEVQPEHLPVVPIPQDPFLPKRRLQRLVNQFPGGQFFRYLLVGGFNTLFGYCTFVITLAFLGNAVPQRFLYLSAPLASLLSTPFNITVAYFGYKLFVFRTKGNHLMEWLKCFAVYGTGMVPGLIALGGLTRLLQGQLHQHAATLHLHLNAIEAHLGGEPLRLVQHAAQGKSIAGNIAGAIVIALSTIYSFVGHKKVTFKSSHSSSATAV
ncbi:MAG: GtrA family protein [Janthinobacterium lividum]